MKYFIEIMFGLGVFFNALLFIPQAIQLFRTKDAAGLSLFTFVGFNIMQLFTVLHGYLNKDYVLMWGFLLSFILCGIVTIMIIFYKKIKRKSYEAESLVELVDLEKILALSTVHIYWLDRNNVYQGCNDQQAKSAGLASRFDIAGKTNSELPWNKRHPDIVELVDNFNLQVMQSGEPVFVEEPAISLDGKKVVFLSHKLPLKDSKGKVIGLLGISIDITNQKAQQDKLQNEKEQVEFTLDYIIAHLPAHVYWKNKDGIYLGSNDLQARSLGLSSGRDLIGKTDFDLPWGQENAAKFRANDLEVMQIGEMTAVEETALINGQPAIVLSQKLPLKNKQGEVEGVMGVSVDITNLKRAKEELIIAKERAELATATQSQFIQNMEHDLRTPASGVSQMLLHLTQQEQNPTQKQILQTLANSSKRLLDLLNEIIAFDKYSTGNVPVLAHKFDIYDLARGIVDMETPTVQNKNIALQLDIAKGVPQYIISDKHRINRILLNLVGNAIKFTKEGSVKIFISVAKEIDSRRLLLKIVVADTGIGIPPDKIHRIYERFERCTPSNKGLYAGSGLGLNITRQFIDELQGEIEVESIECQGTTFTCLIPCGVSLMDMANYDGIFSEIPVDSVTNAEISKKIEIVAAVTSETTAAVVNPEKTRVLLVEDDPIAQLLAIDTIKHGLHFACDLAQTGKEALELWGKNKYEMIFMDLGLPDISGDKVTEKIRQTDNDIIIIAQTAHDSDEMKTLCKKVGMQGFITKPLNFEKIQEVLKALELKESKTTAELPFAEPIIDESQILDFALCVQAANNDEKIAQQLWNVFAKQLPKYLVDLKTSFENKDIKILHEFSHRLKGASSYAGSPRLKIASAALSDATRNQNTRIEDIKELYEKVLVEISEVIRIYKKLGY